jgi:hypothetical protein
MERLLITMAAATVALHVMGVAASAHHAVAGQFDGSKPITLRGPITAIQWENPHIWIYIDARDDGGKVVNWAVECAPPSMMRRAGVEPSLVKVGDRLTINAYQARVAGHTTTAHAYDMVLPDGRRFVIGLQLN